MAAQQDLLSQELLGNAGQLIKWLESQPEKSQNEYGFIPYTWNFHIDGILLIRI